MRAFLVSVVVAIAIAICAAYVLNGYQTNVETASKIESVRL